MAPKWSICGIDDLRASAQSWDDLNRSAANLPFLDFAVIEDYCRHFGDGNERGAVCELGGQLTAAAIVRPIGRGRWQTFQPAQAPLGLWLSLPEFDYATLLKALVDRLPGLCSMLGVTQQDPDIIPRPPSSGLLETLDYIETARVSVNSSFEEYWRARGSNLRQNVRKQRNRLQREGVSVRLERVRSTSDIGEAVDDYGRLESAGWKGNEGTALHPNNAQGRFYRAMFEYCAIRGEASVYSYYFDDRLVASDLCVHRGGVLTILKTAFDESFKAVSPSLLLKVEAFEQLFSDLDIKRIEFYGRAMDWHRRLTDEIRVLYHTNQFRWEWMRRLHKYWNVRRARAGTTASTAT